MKEFVVNTKVSIPLFFHPTTILLIDDNREFLDILSNNIPLEMPTLLKNEALQAYRYLFTHVYSKEATSRVISQNCDYFSYDSAKESFNIDFSKLMEGIETPDRFNTITTVVVDKTMPDLDGILFCQRVREAGLPGKLILLTGTVENQEAVNAFNRRIIDQFIPKTEAQFPKHLAEVIHHLSLQQFRELTDKLSAFVMPKFPILSDEHFQRIFEQTLKKYSIVEYYVLDSNGSFFMADSEGKAYTLLVRTEEDFKESHEMAINSHAPED